MIFTGYIDESDTHNFSARHGHVGYALDCRSVGKVRARPEANTAYVRLYSIPRD